MGHFEIDYFAEKSLRKMGHFGNLESSKSMASEKTSLRNRLYRKYLTSKKGSFENGCLLFFSILKKFAETWPKFISVKFSKYPLIFTYLQYDFF